MKHLLFGSVLLLGANIGLAAEEPAESWPTPYTAEQIRDSWTAGFELTLKTTTPDGASLSTMRVVDWSPSEVTIAAQTVDESGEPAGEAAVSVSSWEALRDHALFPKSSTTRSRERRPTALGELDGWLFTRQEGDGSSSFFFADGLPGPPVVFWSTRGGEVVFSAEMIERQAAN